MLAHERKSGPPRLLLFPSDRAAGASAAANAQTLALVGGNVYASPEAAPLADAVVIASDGVITAIGSRSEVQIPADARVIDCTGKTVVAGFWNSHVHFAQEVWKNAATAPAAALEAPMREMLTRWGFTTVWDLGSDPAASLPLRAASTPAMCSVPTFCLPAISFLRTAIPSICRPKCNCPRSRRRMKPQQMARNYLGMGLDGIKLFTGAFMGDESRS